MKTYIDKKNELYTKKKRVLGNCDTIVEKDIEYHFEFEIMKNEAIITCDSLTFIEEAIIEFRKNKFYITTFYTKDRTFYKSFDPVFTFKLPIKVIQPCHFFIDKNHLKELEKHIKAEEIYLPVAIIDDEYVLIQGETLLYYLYINDYKMVNVYIDSYPPHLIDFIYLAKENNIFNISNLKLLSHEEYETYWGNFYNDYFHNI